jgi:hypothetical protein
MLKRRKSLNFY